MAYSNNYDNSSFYSTFSAPGEFETYPFLDQIPTIEEANIHPYNPLADPWGTTGQPSHLVGSSTSLQATASYESVVSAASHTSQTNNHDQPSHSGHYWSTVGQQAQPYHPNLPSWDGSFASTVTSEEPTVTATPSSVPLYCWGGNQSGPSTSTFQTQNVLPSHQPGPSRTGWISAGRFRPYGMSRTRQTEYRNAEAGPSIQALPPIPYVGPSSPQPSGGISETTANAEELKTITEEDEVPSTKRTRRPRGQGPPRPHRMRTQQDEGKLRRWVQQREGLRKPPSLNRALEVAAGLITTIRPVVNSEPCLAEGRAERAGAGSKRADREAKKRKIARRLFGELSQYYPLEQNDSTWTCPSLLGNVIKDLEDLPALPGPSNEAPP